VYAAPAGAADENARRRRPSARRLLVVLLACGVVSSAARCGASDESAPPSRLVDGSRARAPSLHLEGVDGPAIQTRVRIQKIASVDEHSFAGSCLANDWGTEPASIVVERTSASGESATFLSASRRQVLGCDYGGRQRDGGRPWCGVAAGQLPEGRLRDPRLDLGCTTSREEALAFVWVQPTEHARYVAVQEHGYAEVYEVAGGLPVRITTSSDVDVDSLSASFAVSEHTADGKLLREYGLTATPAG
jgi:hypothetical protein